MKIKVTVIKEYEYDEAKELARLKSCFKGAVLKRQLAIFNAFLAKDLEKVSELYHELPYNSKAGCPEQEFVGIWMSILADSWGIGEYLTNQETLYEY